MAKLQLPETVFFILKEIFMQAEKVAGNAWEVTQKIMRGEHYGVEETTKLSLALAVIDSQTDSLFEIQKELAERTGWTEEELLKLLFDREIDDNREERLLSFVGSLQNGYKEDPNKHLADALDLLEDIANKLTCIWREKKTRRLAETGLVQSNTTTHVAKFCGTDTTTVRKWVRKGCLHRDQNRLGRRPRFIYEDVIACIVKYEIDIPEPEK